MKEEDKKIPGTPVFPNNPDIVWDLWGYPYNAKYPPEGGSCAIRNGEYVSNHGYDTEEEECIFYFFAVQLYDLQFTYKGKWYYFGTFDGYVARTDEHFTKEYEVFPTANAMLENFKIDGRPLIDLIGELEDVEQM